MFGANIGFSMRTFHFKTHRSSIEQQQTLACNVHLDPIDAVPSTQPDDCACYSEVQCSEESSEESSEEESEVEESEEEESEDVESEDEESEDEESEDENGE